MVHDTQQLPCLAATFHAATTFAVLTVLAIMHTLHAQMCAECVPPSLAAQHIMNSSGSAHKTRSSGGVHLCHRHCIPLPTQTPSPFMPTHPSYYAHHADQPVPANACLSMTPHRHPHPLVCHTWLLTVPPPLHSLCHTPCTPPHPLATPCTQGPTAMCQTPNNTPQ